MITGRRRHSGVTLQAVFEGLVGSVGKEDGMRLGIWVGSGTLRTLCVSLGNSDLALWAVGNHGKVSAVEQGGLICILERSHWQAHGGWIGWGYNRLLQDCPGRNNGALNPSSGRWGRVRWAI